MANYSNAAVGYYMAVNSSDGVGTTATRWPGAVGSGEVVGTAAKATSIVATSTKVAIESIKILTADASASTITLRNQADDATLPGGAIPVPAAADIQVPWDIFFGPTGLVVDGGFSVDVSATALNFHVYFREIE